MFKGEVFWINQGDLFPFFSLKPICLGFTGILEDLRDAEYDTINLLFLPNVHCIDRFFYSGSEGVCLKRRAYNYRMPLCKLHR